MNSRHCPVCNSIKTIKKGKISGRQRYLCRNCGHIWVRARRKVDRHKSIWHDYAFNNMTINGLVNKYSVTKRIVQKVIKNYQVEPPQNLLKINYDVQVITLDATYIEGRNHGLLVAINANTGKALYASRLNGVERVVDYEKALTTLLPLLPNLRACVIDGRKGVREMILDYGLLVQNCQFHQISLINHRLSRHPRTEAGVELRNITIGIAHSDQTRIQEQLNLWKSKYELLLKEKTYYTDHQNKKRWHYTHRNLRSAFYSLERNLPYLYTYQQYPEYNIPNTSNRIDGLFSVIKKHIRTHSGCDLRTKYKLCLYLFSIDTGVKKYKKVGV